VVVNGVFLRVIHRLLKNGAVHHSNVAASAPEDGHAVAPLEPIAVAQYGGGSDGPYGPAISRC